MAQSTCLTCGHRIVSGFTVAVMVSSCGRGKRFQKYCIAAQICSKCSKSPGGRKTRSKLWMALRDTAKQGIAHIESSQQVLTLVKNNQKGT